MTFNIKKLLIIIIPVVIIIIIASITLLYFTTDFLKPNKTLFFKYLTQNVDAAKIVIDNKSEKEYSNKLKQNKYEAKTTAKAGYTENMNSTDENKKNAINKMTLNIDTQSDYSGKYLYKNIALDYDNNSILRTTIIKDGNLYGIGFPERFNQFLLAEEKDFKEVSEKAGYSEEFTNIVPDNIQEYDLNNVFSFSDEELEKIKNKYLNVIDTNIPKEKFSKQKNALITVGEQEATTTAYSITITQEEANNLYIKLLEELKTDEVLLNKISQIEPLATVLNLVRDNSNDAYNSKFLEESYVNAIEKKIEDITKNNIGSSEVKYTVYEYKGKTIRTQISEATKDIVLEYDITDNNNIKVNIHNKNVNEQEVNKEDIEISKTYNDGEYGFSIKRDKTLGEEVSSIEIFRNKKINDNNATINMGFTYNDEKDNLLKITMDEEVEFKDNFKKVVEELTPENSVVTNEYEKELVSDWFKQINEYLQNVRESSKEALSGVLKIKAFSKLFDISENPQVNTETPKTTEVEKNRFNSKFEFYVGKEKKAEDVVKLLEEAKTCLKKAQVSYKNDGSTEGTKKLQSIKLEVEDGANEKDLADSIIEMINTSNTYTVEVVKDNNDIIKEVLITVKQ